MNGLDLKFKITILFVILMLSTLMEATPPRRKACSPLPQCCRRYVHSIGCRGVTAKRNSYAALPQENIGKSSRFILDTDIPTVTNSQRVLEQNEEFEDIDPFRNVLDDGINYFVN